MKMLKWSAVALVILVLIVSVSAYVFLKQTVADYDGKVAIQGLKAPVEVVRDQWGVPNIYAENEEDAYFALGYAMAQDRLFQMVVMKLLAQGRMSELMGKSMIDTDMFFRVWGAAYDLDEFDQTIRDGEVFETLDAFVKGINHFINDPHGLLPIEFYLLGYRPEEFSIQDIGTLILVFEWTNTDSLKTEPLKAAIIREIGEDSARDLFIDHSESNPTTLPDDFTPLPGFNETLEGARSHRTQLTETGPPDFERAFLEAIASIEAALECKTFPKSYGACNNLVISGEHTVSGQPIVAHDFHYPYVIPSYLYEAHINTPDLTLGGNLIVGYPFVFSGMNRHMAWAFTAGSSDAIDFYVERLHPDDHDRYLYEDTYEEMAINRETIKVKGGDDVDFAVRVSRHGPIVDDSIDEEVTSQFPETALSMRMALTDSYLELEALYHMNRATSVDEFLAAAKLYKRPDMNWVYADTRGEIGYFFSGAIPIRRGFDGTVPVPGWTGDSEWQGYVPSDQHPQIRNPRSGFINTSNSKPVSDSYPYFLGDDFAPGDRFRRVQEIINETISDKNKFAFDDVDKVFDDVQTVMARDWVPLIISAVEGESLSVPEEEALDFFRNWNLDSRKEQVAPMVFQATLLAMIENAFSAHLGETLYTLYIDTNSQPIKALKHIMTSEVSPWFDEPATPHIENRGEFLAVCFKEAVARLTETIGEDVSEWKLGKLLTLTLRNSLSSGMPSFFAPLLNVGPLPMDGGFVVPKASSYQLNHPFETTSGSLARFAVDVSDFDQAKIISMPGIHGHFMSRHYDDQVKMWRELSFRPFGLESSEDGKYRLEMLPK